MKQLAPNTMVQNRYLVVQQIGKGGMGEVYLAVDQRLGSAVALKRTRFESDSELGKAFEREAKILARLRHPVLPKVIDHFLEGNDQFLVMEHISGDDLAKRLETAGKPFPLSWAMFWADQLLDALNYLHSHEPPIIHRDIKPQNLKLTDDNHIVLLDFGLSKDFESTNTGGSSGVGSIVGYSPGFAPMEQVRGTGTDARSDLYSLAATMYQVLTNIAPADALARVDDMLGGGKDPVKPINEINSDVSAGISEVLLKGMSVRQDERFATAAEMQKALRRAYNHAKAGTTPEPAATPEAVRAEPAPAEAASQPAPVTSPGLGGTTMDATVRMEASELETVLKQADIKTAILSGDDIEIPIHTSETAQTASVPPVTTNPPEPPSAPEETARPVAAAATAAAGAYTTPVAPAAIAPVRKERSKTGLIVGVLIGLFVIGGIAAGGGYLAYTRYAAKPTPAPTAAPTVAPVPSPTAAVSADDQNIAPNSNTEVSDSNTSPSNSVASPGNTRSTANPKEPGKTTAPKATPKTKGKDDRTTILQ